MGELSEDVLFASSSAAICQLEILRGKKLIFVRM